MPSNFYAKRKLTIDTVTWTAVVAPIDCDSLAMRNDTASTKIRTDSADPNTEDTIGAGVQEGIIAPIHEPAPFPVRFKNGDTICYLQAVSGTGPVILTFVR